MHKQSLLLFLVLCLYAGVQAQTTDSTWAKWQFLIGNWEGVGTGKPGEGKGGFSLQPELDGKVLIRRNHADYPAQNGRPSYTHNDIMMISPLDKKDSFEAVYYDNEGHVINYIVSFTADGTILFISEAAEKSPRFKLTYKSMGTDKVSIKFEIAPPGKPDSFSPYIDATAIRKH